MKLEVNAGPKIFKAASYTSVLFTGMQVFGTNTTENAVDAYSPDTEGTYVGGTRTCYAVKQKFRQKSKEILN